MRSNLDLSIVVAMTPDRVIGVDNKLPWGRIPSDLRRFKEITLEGEGTVIMGRATHDSIVDRLKGPLPLRHHIVLTRTPRSSGDGRVEYVTSLDGALALAKGRGASACVIGGAQIYELCMPVVTRLYVTTVHAHLYGDTHFPVIGTEWKLYSGKGEVRQWDAADAHETSFNMYGRNEG
jgi:dihydrofolate reductase